LPVPVNNEPPQILATTTAAPIEGVVTIDLVPLITDEDDNLDLSTLQLLTEFSAQGAVTSITDSYELILDYGGLKFSGTDIVTIEVCDFLSECVQQDLTIEVTGDVLVYNAMSPNGDGTNDSFVIKYIDIIPDTQSNKVTIFNRWGDSVFEISNYNNTDRVFNGLNSNGKELPSGTYFYKIEFSGRESKTGFLSLKR
jgi:gliding motility-associated-like protein